MNQEHGKQKPGKRKRRNPEQPQKPPLQSAATSPPSTHRMSRKEAAQAQAKKNRQLRILIGGVAAVILLVAIVIFVNRPTDSGIQIDYSGIAISQSEVVRNSGSMPGDSSRTRSHLPPVRQSVIRTLQSPCTSSATSNATSARFSTMRPCP